MASCHLYYTDFARYGCRSTLPTYINIIRNPQERLISFYYFIRFFPNHQRPMSDAKRNMSYDECVRQNDDECTGAHSKGYWTLIPYFCGHDPVCRKPSQAALEQAKANVMRSYAVVGITEDVDSFTQVLEQTIPKYFKGLAAEYQILKRRNKAYSNAKRKVKPKPETLEKMRPLLKLENEFYEFVKNRFYNQVDYLRCQGHEISG
ncbi:hypothetical protein CAPTEDRAFT_106349 [Capitella teleta]|uniref:Uncharacterized protein n=1 Tax=Capitella teleta TaxID=283909 RepID=R7VLR3_CAPTE|nr:hypothetical protein CAPTEDRAFT_106349 [Capitella teleta]|eukprot:ELU17830.1 hypothetical protein CAPTEDRAFT_106349 [Capitella teleta]